MVALLVGLVCGATLSAQTVYVAFGDSITAGTGDSVPLGPDAGYPRRLEALLTNATVLNYGTEGDNTAEALEVINSVLADADGDVLLLMLGTNDVQRGSGLSLESTIFNLRELANRATNRGMAVVHASPIPRRESARQDSDNVLTDRVVRGIREIAGGEGRDLVDNYEVWITRGDLQSLYDPVPASEDAVGHPNPQGYDLMARTFADVLQGLDNVPPVPSVISPENKAVEVPDITPVTVQIWDFGAGIDMATVELRIDGQIVESTVVGTTRNVTIQHEPPVPWSGTVNVSLRAADLDTPANVFDRAITEFRTDAVGGGFGGDVDGDGRVDGIDLILLGLAFGADLNGSRWDQRADLNDDLAIDGSDLAIVAANFGTVQGN